MLYGMTERKEANMKRFYWAGSLSYMLIGLAHVIMGSLLPNVLGYYSLEYQSGGLLISLQFFGFLIGVLSGPWWSGKLGRRGALVLALISLAAAELIFGLLPPWPILLAAAPFAGFGFGMVESLIGSLVMIFFVREKAKVMARLEVFFGVGALAMPLASSFFISAGIWRAAFFSLSIMTVLMLLIWAFARFGSMDSALNERKQAEKKSDIPTSRALRRGEIVSLTLFILIFFLYVGMEMSFANFLPSMLIEKVQLTPEKAALGATLFWGFMSIGRLFAAQLAEKMKFVRYMLVSSLGAGVVLAGFSAVSGVSFSFVLIGALGLIMSGMFAISLVYANEWFPGQEEKTTSILIASGGVGGALLPLMTGWFMDHLAVRNTVWVLVALAMIMFLLVAIAALRNKKQSPIAASSGDLH